MPKTVWLGNKRNLRQALQKINTNLVVLKPTNGLMGIGVFIGTKKQALKFRFKKKYVNNYIAQEFLDTSLGINGIAKGTHDLRIVMINNKIVWAHVRTPRQGEHRANAALGGTLKEVPLKKIPLSVKKIAKEISSLFYKEYDNPLFSLDFGMTNAGPKIIEINDQIGFPTWGMKNREKFLKELINNFSMKLEAAKRHAK